MPKSPPTVCAGNPKKRPAVSPAPGGDGAVLWVSGFLSEGRNQSRKVLGRDTSLSLSFGAVVGAVSTLNVESAKSVRGARRIMTFTIQDSWVACLTVSVA